MPFYKSSKQRTAYGFIAGLLAVSVAFGLHHLYRAAKRELEIDEFAPKRPSGLPPDTIWINAPPLPLTFAHGWWLGCERRDEQVDRCILIRHNDRMSGGNGDNSLESDASYVSCRTSAPLEPQKLILIPPPTSFNMWLGYKDSREQWVSVPAVFLQNHDILVPPSLLSKCSTLLVTQ